MLCRITYDKYHTEVTLCIYFFLFSPKVLSQKKMGVNRNFMCPANINIRVSKVNKNTIRNNESLNRGFSAYITIKSHHNHRVKVAEAFSMLRCNPETDLLFEGYFQSGMTPATAMLHHEMYLLETMRVRRKL